MERARAIFLRTTLIIFPLGLVLIYLALAPGSWAEVHIASVWYLAHQAKSPVIIGLVSLAILSILVLFATSLIARRRFTRDLRVGAVPVRRSEARSEAELLRRARENLEPALSSPRPRPARLIDAILTTPVDLGAAELLLVPRDQIVEVILRFGMDPLPVTSMSHQTFVTLLKRLRLIIGVDNLGHGTIELHGGIAAAWIDVYLESNDESKNSLDPQDEKAPDVAQDSKGDDDAEPRVRLIIGPRAEDTRALGDLGFPSDVLARLDAALARDHGLIVFGGENNAGLATTLYAAAHRIHQRQSSPRKPIVSLESHLHRELPFMTQIEVGDANPAAVLRATLGEASPVIIVHQIRDAATASLAVEAARRRLVLVSLEASGALGALASMLNLAEPTLIAETLLLAQGQACLPRLCPSCRRASAPNTKERKGVAEYTLPETIYHAVGCDRCGGRGVQKAPALIAWSLEPTPWLKALLNKPRRVHDLQRAATHEGYHGPTKVALAAAARGDLAIDDALALIKGWEHA
ncbi:MAG: Flp pilus assembly complex ATPase component TadA [Deltaproteobacteria bacterium]|nr:Flp pilus assembly complex ATPase component TadA [Deltaproteobacteria bacterium]